jgi:hypothetical protein
MLKVIINLYIVGRTGIENDDQKTIAKKLHQEKNLTQS